MTTIVRCIWNVRPLRLPVAAPGLLLLVVVPASYHGSTLQLELEKLSRACHLRVPEKNLYRAEACGRAGHQASSYRSNSHRCSFLLQFTERNHLQFLARRHS